MNRKLMIASAIIAGGIGTAGLIAIPAVVLADTSTSTSSNVSEFVQKLAAKLGLSQDTVQSALESVKTDMKAEHDAQYKADLATAVTNGKLTQRQADILTALMDVEPPKPTNITKPDFTGLTEDQIKAKMDEMRTQMDQTIVDALNQKGLNTTVAELQAAQQAARDADLKGGEFGFHVHGGPDFEFKMMP